MGWAGHVSLWVPGQLGLTALRDRGRVTYHFRTTAGTEFSRHRWVWLLLATLVGGAYEQVCGGVQSGLWSETQLSLLPGPRSAFSKWTSLVLGFISVSQSPTCILYIHRGTSVCAWLPNHCCWGEMQEGGLLFHCVADVTHPHTSLWLICHSYLLYLLHFI